MRVLVTGATGGLGELVIRELLKQNIKVIATSRNAEKARECDFYTKVTYVPFDIYTQRNTDLFSFFHKPDALIHLAWEKLDDYKNEAHTSSILENHKRFLSDLIGNGLSDVTVVGTCYEYGLQEGVLKESMASKPVLPYPEGKNRLMEFLEAKQKTKTFSLKWPRIFYIFGEVKGRKNLYTHLMNALKNNEESFNMSGGEQVRDFLTPDEIAMQIVKIALQNRVTGVINCCSGNPVKLKEFVTEFLAKNNYKIKLNLGVYPYPDYEPMETWGDTEKLNQVLEQK
jgi:nucleoside-diphosphate-sugar epimerase